MSRGGLLAAAPALLALLAGCNTGEPAGDTAVVSEVLRIGLDDYDVRTSADAAAPGTLRLDVRNVGRDTHDLQIDAGGQPLGATETLAPGATSELSVDVPADASELELWCTLPGHRAQGMATTLRVTDRSDVSAPSQAEGPR